MSHYFSEKQDSRLDIKKIKILVKDRQLDFFSSSGIFSKEELDKGSRLLIETAIIKENSSILDLGCGIGVIGISLKMMNPGIKVTMSDINERAVMISRKNIALHSLEDIDAKKSDVFSNIKESFDSILLNPPQTAGKQLCFRMIEESKKHLNKEGSLQLVARHTKGGETLSKKMEDVFGNVETISKDSGFRVYVSYYS